MTGSETESKENLSQSISAQLFLGCPITSEIRLYLNSSPSWKQIQTLPGENVESLKEVHHEEKSYIGTFLKKPQPTLEELKAAQDNIRKLLKGYCKELKVDNLKLNIFPQIFLS
ncbi:MAG: hypothetical protein ACI9S8_002336 [Chlamydiales bacterium]|jgi:hypothetical protein